MAKFLFKLQGLFTIKEKLETQKKNEYGQTIKELEDEKQKKETLVAEKNDCIYSFKRSVNAQINSNEFQMYNYYIELLKKKIILQDKAIQAAERRVELKRLELVEAMKERKMMENLREKAYEEYLKEELMAEQKIVDEIVSYQYNEREA